MSVGCRVVRGPDWTYGNQDGGEGHLGIVVEIGKPGSTNLPEKTAAVIWDSGGRGTYRAGQNGACDLRIFDNATTGVNHPNIVCGSCGEPVIHGMRWHCTVCTDSHLCTICYMADKHDLTHPFQRFDTASSEGEAVPKREGCTEIQAKGIFPGAKVVRGPDWEWGDQDGGIGNIGQVTSVGCWARGLTSVRSAVKVKWPSGSTYGYRVGHEGKVDLVYTEEESGGSYYKDHLPVLDHTAEVAPSSGIPREFKVGEKVKVELGKDRFQSMQEGHGAWNPRMASYIGKIGTVHDVSTQGDVIVRYEGLTRWWLHPETLTKVQSFSVNDVVRILDDVEKVKNEQEGHGGWIEVMRSTLNKEGRVVKVFDTGDLRVRVQGEVWTFNPSCCILVRPGAEEINNTLGGNDDDNNDDDDTGTLKTILKVMYRVFSTLVSGPERLVKEAAEGNTEAVREFVAKFPEKVDQTSSSLTALQMACHEGHMDIVQILLTAGAKTNVQDQDGNTPLHLSAYKNFPEIVELLLKKGADVNVQNKRHATALHMAVNKKHPQCVKVLLKHKCNANIQDTYGDTALHDAIVRENDEIIELLVNYPGIDFTIQNNRGFNPLHQAALKGSNLATKEILKKSRQIVDVKKEDGFTALHLAAFNDHKEICETLLTVGQADINSRNNQRATPLLLAVSQGYSDVVTLLVSKGADLTAEDQDGDTCLHMALMRHHFTTEIETAIPILKAIRTELKMTQNESQTGADIACYLVQHGASLTHRNHQGKTPMDLINDPRIRDAIRRSAESCHKK